MTLFDEFRALVDSEVSHLADQRLSLVEEQLAETVSADEIRFLNVDRKPIHGKTLFRKALEMARYVEVRLPLENWTRAESPQPPPKSFSETVPVALDSSTETPTTTQGSGIALSVTFNEQFFIREFDRRERERGDIWAGFVVNDLLPGLGFSAFESKRILRQLEAQGVVQTSTRPNPANPEHPATFVRLNRDHPRVRAALQNGVSMRARVRVTGEPVSETIIRERR